jgi:hypothetical protein
MIPLKKPDKKAQQAKPTGTIRYRPPKGDDSERPLEKIHKEYEVKRRASR